MRANYVWTTLAILSFSATIAACGTPAPGQGAAGSHSKTSSAGGGSKTHTAGSNGGSGTRKMAGGTTKTSTKSGSTTGTHKSTASANPSKSASHVSKTNSASGSSTGKTNSSNKAALSGSTTGTKSGTGTGGSTKGGKSTSKTSGKSVNSSSNRSGVSHAMKLISLTTLPTMTAIMPFNHMKAYHEVSTFVNDMGYHWQTQVPGVVFMTNQHNQITAVETIFPQNLGEFSWYDPATPATVPNASLAFYSEHLYFVPPSSITPSMSATMPTALASWTAFVTNNPRLKAYVKEPTTFRGYTVYGPPNGPGIDVLVSSSGLVSGFCVAEPASWGDSPLYVKAKASLSKVYSRSFYSVFMLEPRRATASKSATT